MVWSLALDDFTGSCSDRKYPLLTAINERLGMPMSAKYPLMPPEHGNHYSTIITQFPFTDTRETRYPFISDIFTLPDRTASMSEHVLLSTTGSHYHQPRSRRILPVPQHYTGGNYFPDIPKRRRYKYNVSTFNRLGWVSLGRGSLI